MSDEREHTTTPRAPTTVVNVRVQYIRPKGHHNLREWILGPDNIYVGRGGVLVIEGARFPPRSSPWANPFKVGRDGTRQVVARKFYNYMTQKLDKNPLLQNELRQLRGNRLGCWCVPEDWVWEEEAHHARGKRPEEFLCHAQILCQLIDRYS